MPAKPWPQTTASQVSSLAKSVTSAGGVIQLVSVTLWICTSDAPAPWAVAWVLASPALSLPPALLPDGAQPASPASAGGHGGHGAHTDERAAGHALIRCLAHNP